MNRQEMIRWIHAHGAVGVIQPEDVPEFIISTQRVFDLLSDREWHDAEEIRLAAGNDCPASEGLRRKRDVDAAIKPLGLFVNKRIKTGHLWEYRIEQMSAEDLDQYYIQCGYTDHSVNWWAKTNGFTFDPRQAKVFTLKEAEQIRAVQRYEGQYHIWFKHLIDSKATKHVLVSELDVTRSAMAG